MNWTDFFNNGINHNYFLDSLNKTEKTIAEPDNFKKLIELFYDVTDKAFEEKVKVV